MQDSTSPARMNRFTLVAFQIPLTTNCQSNKRRSWSACGRPLGRLQTWMLPFGAPANPVC